VVGIESSGEGDSGGCGTYTGGSGSNKILIEKRV